MILSDSTGLELVNYFLRENPGIKVILSSGYTDDKVQLDIENKKGFKFVQKPYNMNDILKAIKEVLTS